MTKEPGEWLSGSLMLYTYKQLKDGVAARTGPDYVVTFRNIFITAVTDNRLD